MAKAYPKNESRDECGKKPRAAGGSRGKKQRRRLEEAKNGFRRLGRGKGMNQDFGRADRGTG